MTEYILFLGFVLVVSGVLVWSVLKGISHIQKSPDFTDLEAVAIRRQMLALLGLPLFLLFIVLYSLAGDESSPYAVFLAMTIGFAPLAYISVSSIRNRVSILRRRERLPVKGTKAVSSGVMNLVFILLAFTGFAIYFASVK